jgi:P-aminobenzoate N-oxygenase AurF
MFAVVHPEEPVNTDVAQRIERLSSISAKRVIDPDAEVAGTLGSGQVLPDDLLSTRDLGLELSTEQRRRLAAEEVAAITEVGIRFESILISGFGIQIERAADLTDPWVTYALHEIGEETRHSRLFVRLLGQLEATAVNPFERGLLGWFRRRVLDVVIKQPPLFYALVLAGEEIPDLIQKRSSEHPGTDPFLARVSRYHRQEEARHLSFARLRLPELVAAASRRQRAQLRWLAPVIIQAQFEGLLHPGIYRAAGLPGWRTWWRVHRSPSIVQLRNESTRPILREVLAAGAFPAGRVPRGWQRLCGVDRKGGAHITAAREDALT